MQSLGGQLAGAGEGIAQWGDALVLWSAEPEAEAQEALEPKKPEDQEAEKETKKPEDQVLQQQQQQQQ